jgi:hypothetical protein
MDDVRNSCQQVQYKPKCCPRQKEFPPPPPLKTDHISPDTAMKTIIGVVSITSKTVLFTLMFRLLPINSHDMNRSSAEINFHKKGKK